MWQAGRGSPGQRDATARTRRGWHVRASCCELGPCRSGWRLRLTVRGPMIDAARPGLCGRGRGAMVLSSVMFPWRSRTQRHTESSDTVRVVLPLLRSSDVLSATGGVASESRGRQLQTRGRCAHVDLAQAQVHRGRASRAQMKREAVRRLSAAVGGAGSLAVGGDGQPQRGLARLPPSESAPLAGREEQTAGRHRRAADLKAARQLHGGVEGHARVRAELDRPAATPRIL